jgi:hypothetical protein
MMPATLDPHADLQWVAWTLMFTLLFVLLLPILVMSLIVAAQASRRGYSLLLWLVAGCLGNPIFLLILLAIMPDRARLARRRQELFDLEKKLADRAKRAAAELEPASVVLPPAAASSLGDQPTVLPPVRSLGDEETRA